MALPNAASSGLNVAGLLAQMYMSGDRAMPTPPPTVALQERTIHSLYAISFIIYSVNVACDWLHTWWACTGESISFEMQPWLAVTMVTCCVAGTVFTFLLMVLCIENAFTNRVPIDPYHGGFSLILEVFGNWITSFNCFRISFLVLVVQDAPMTFVNFWFLSSCRISNPILAFWPLALSGFSTLLSLGWKLIMLFYAYRHFWFFRLNKVQLNQINRESSTVDELRLKVDVRNADRVHDFDECWPVRYSYQQTYGTTSRPGSQNHNHNHNQNNMSRSPSGDSVKFPEMKCILGKGLQACVCCCMCGVLYCVMCMAGCLPCCYHYSCTKNAGHHRHKFAKTCTRICSTGYNIFVLLFSTILTLTLFIVTCMWLSSVQVIGNTDIPPELRQLCIQVHKAPKTIQPVLMPYKSYVNNRTHFIDCKPLFESNGWGFGFSRVKPVPWILNQKLFGNDTVTVWSDVILDYGGKNKPAIMFDYGVETHWNFKSKCAKYDESEWKLATNDYPLSWPYFRACTKSYSVVHVRALTCENNAILVP